jgi:polyphosphate glucokinase
VYQVIDRLGIATSLPSVRSPVAKGRKIVEDRPQEMPAEEPIAPIRTLSVDVGGTGIKALVLNERGDALAKPIRARTPVPATPERVLRVVTRIATRHRDFDRVSLGFPGVVRDGVVKEAPNLSREWQHVNAVALFEGRIGKPVRILNDADMQGFGAIAGKGVELVITLGTGCGSALFVDGKLVPNVEVGRPKLGEAGRKKVGTPRWHRRVEKFVRRLEEMFHFDQLYVGGGNSGRLDIKKLPAHVRIVSNLNGLIGGIALWRNAAFASVEAEPAREEAGPVAAPEAAPRRRPAKPRPTSKAAKRA